MIDMRLADIQLLNARQIIADTIGVMAIRFE